MVALSPLGGAAGQFLDNNGVILSGGKLYTYAAGTTNPQATYTSVSGATAHGNPIVLDSAGRVPGGEIWLTQGVTYKFVIETALGVLLGTYDNLSGVNDISVTASDILFTPAGAGATVRNVQSKLRDVVSVKDFGAVSDYDGTTGTDNLSAFNAAFAYAGSSTQKSVFIPAGDYYFSDIVVLTHSNVTVYAYGARFFSESSTGCVLIGQNGARVQKTSWFGGQYFRAASAVDYTAGFGIRLLNANWCCAEPESIIGWRAGLSLYGSTGQGSSYCSLKINQITDCLFPIEVFADGTGAFVNDNNFYGGRAGYTSSTPDASGGYNIYISLGNGATNIPNMNRFWGVALESPSAISSLLRPEAPVYNNGVRNSFFEERFEGAWKSSFYIVEGPDVPTSGGRNKYYGGYSLNPSEIDMATKRNLVLGEGSIYVGGGTVNSDPMLILSEASSNSNPAIKVEDISNTDVFSVLCNGSLTLRKNGGVGTGYISGTTLTITSTPGASLSLFAVGQLVIGEGVDPTTTITALGTGTGGTGTYTVSVSQTVGSAGSPIDITSEGLSTFLVNTSGEVQLASDPNMLLRRVSKKRSSLSFGSIGAQSFVDRTITVNGLTTVSNAVVVATPEAHPGDGLVWNSWISAVDAVTGIGTITVRLSNITGSSIASTNRVWNVTMSRYSADPV